MDPFRELRGVSAKPPIYGDIVVGEPSECGRYLRPATPGAYARAPPRRQPGRLGGEQVGYVQRALWPDDLGGKV